MPACAMCSALLPAGYTMSLCQQCLLEQVNNKASEWIKAKSLRDRIDSANKPPALSRWDMGLPVIDKDWLILQEQYAEERRRQGEAREREYNQRKLAELQKAYELAMQRAWLDLDPPPIQAKPAERLKAAPKPKAAPKAPEKPNKLGRRIDLEEE